MRRQGLATLCALIVLTLTVLPPASPQAALATSASDGMLQATSFPFSDGFEDATLGSEWSVSSSGPGVVELNTDNVYNGNQSVFLGQRIAGNVSVRLLLAPNLTGQNDVFLDFWVRATGMGEARRVSISDDRGANWIQIANLDDVSQTFSHVVIDVAGAAAASGLALNGNFRILFEYFALAGGDVDDGMLLDDIRLTQRNQFVLPFPILAESFETAAFPQGFYPLSSGTGTVEFTGDYARSGAQSVFLGQRIGGNATARLLLTPDLTGQSDVFLDFWVRATGMGEARRVSISDNGGANWTQIANLDDVSQTFGHIVIDVAGAAAASGLVLNDNFHILFEYSHRIGGDVDDGMILDDIRLTRSNRILAPFPLTAEDFESNAFIQGLYPLSFGSGTVEFTSDYSISGSQSLFLGQNAAGDAGAQLIIALDLSNQASVFLDFWVLSTGAGESLRLSISDNSGATWTEIRNLDDVSQSFSQVTVDLVDAAQDNDLALNDEFRIRFSYFDRAGGDVSDGMVIDSLNINRTPAPAPENTIAYLPLVGR